MNWKNNSIDSLHFNSDFASMSLLAIELSFLCSITTYALCNTMLKAQYYQFLAIPIATCVQFPVLLIHFYCTHLLVKEATSATAILENHSTPESSCWHSVLWWFWTRCRTSGSSVCQLICEPGTSQMWSRSPLDFAVALNEFERVACLDTITGMPEGTDKYHEEHQVKMWKRKMAVVFRDRDVSHTVYFCKVQTILWLILSRFCIELPEDI
jgi:hypothetical protein